MANLTVKPVQTRREQKQFVQFPWTLYQDDPNWIPPAPQPGRAGRIQTASISRCCGCAGLFWQPGKGRFVVESPRS